ncbi:MAG: EAL domain-containing protein [Gammaproteobacteria bacterium]|nr:EAL domain-containing protein [Gammaproteobacteria bacterium]
MAAFLNHTRTQRLSNLGNMISRLRLPGSLQARLTAAFSGLILLTAVLVTIALAKYTAHVQLEAQENFGHRLIQTLAPVVQGMIATDKVFGLDGYVSHIADDPAIAAIRITDASGTRLYEYVHDTEPAAWYTRLLTPEATTPRRLSTTLQSASGAKHVEFTLAVAPLNAAVHHLIVQGAAVTATLLLLTFIIAYTLLARFTAPLKPLTEWAREFSRGNWKPGIKLMPSSSREIQELNQAFTDGSAAMRHYINSLSEARELLEHSETQLRKLIDGMHEILFEIDSDGQVVFLNPAWERLTGHKIDETIGKTFSDFLLDEDAVRDFAPQHLAELHEKGREVPFRTASGKKLWVSVDADAQIDSGGVFTGVIGTLGDITKSVELNRLLSRYQDELYHMSVTDPLTGLYNRRHFDTQLEVILSDHLTKSRSVCLLLIDLDGFKFINDTYGHPFGDEVLRTTAQLLKQQVRRNDYIARLAGDEFAMVLKNTNLENATKIAQKLHQQISLTRVPLPVGSMQLQSSLGVAEAPTHGRNAQELVSAADVALYHSKRRGRNRIEVLSPDVSQAMMSIFSQGFQLRTALEEGNIHPAFQPICDMQTGLPMAYEVLARMRVNGTIIQAKDFIAVAEELGLTRDVDLHIIRTALAITPAEQALFLNVDLSSFNDRGYVKELGSILKPSCEAGRAITIEITERESIPISDTLRQDIQELRALGCKLALDDFGSGYSTYNFLNQFRPDYLKIEGSFVRGMVDNESDRKIVTHIHTLAQSFGMQTIAESVENEATHQALRKIGIGNAQGLLFGLPQLGS